MKFPIARLLAVGLVFGCALPATADAPKDNKGATPMLFDPMEPGQVDSSAQAAPLVPADALPSAPSSKQPSAAIAPAGPALLPGVGIEQVHPGATPVDASKLLPAGPQVSPSRGASASPPSTGARRFISNLGPRPEASKVTMYPPRIATTPAPAATPPPVEGTGSGAFTVDLVKPEAIEVASGVNTIIPISKGHLNRIITPFSHPDVKTVSKATIQTSENVVYLATNDDVPIALYLRETGHENPAMDLTLIPRAIPPRELTLVASEGTLKQIRAETTVPQTGSTPLETSYVSKIRDELRATAQGQIPPGFSLRQPEAGDPGVFCMDPALRIATGQVLEGTSHVILVAQAVNISSVNVEIDETGCHQPGVLAVSAWPTPFVKPGGTIELFEVHKRATPVDYDRERPSLIPFH